MNLDELEKLHPQAWKALTLILAGKPQLSIPPQPGDSDKVISACLDALPLLIAVARAAEAVYHDARVNVQVNGARYTWDHETFIVKEEKLRDLRKSLAELGAFKLAALKEEA